MEFIDCNAAVGHIAAEDGVLFSPSPQALLAAMDDCRIGTALCWNRAASVLSVEEGNRGIREICAEEPRLLPVWVALPASAPDLREASEAPAAVRILPKTMGFSVRPYAAAPLFAAMRERALPCLVDFDQLGADSLYDMATDYCGVNFIVTSLYYRNLRFIIPLLQQCPNVFLETSLLKTFHVLEDLCAAAGAHRLLFGTGMPVHDPGCAAAMILAADLATEEKEQIAHGTIEGLLHRGTRP